MKKIVLLPLDERPCNYDFPVKLFNNDNIKIVRPDNLGDKKNSADTDEIIKFLKRECKTADGLVLSIDTLIYGGLIPSRLHQLSKEILEKRLEIVKELKNENPQLKIYAFQVIMRCPKYSSSDEEPDYYEICGEQIHKIGSVIHKAKLGLCDEAELGELYKIAIPEYLDDYTQRRKLNIEFNLKTLDYVKNGDIDFLIIPQDDSAKYGYTAMDQEIIREKITSELLQYNVLMYPGADEVAMTLIARFVNTFNEKTPKVYIKYASIHAPFIIPSYEDRSLGETIKYQLIAANCRIADSLGESDLALAVNCPANEMGEAVYQPIKNQNYCVERNITEFVLFIEDCIKAGKPVTIGDNAYANGADLELIALLNKKELLDKVAGYAGWNTSSNTLGTAIAEGVNYLYNKNSEEHYNFLAARYIEDAGYCSVVRSYVSDNFLEKLGMNYFDVKEKDGEVSRLVKKYLQKFVDSQLSSISKYISINSIIMPWRRMFEVGVDVSFKK